MSHEGLKQVAAQKAIGHVESGMLVGLGTGSTAWHFIQALGEYLREGRLHNIMAVATSRVTEIQAQQLGIPLIELYGQTLDLAVDGMDEVDDDLNAIKGLGGALTREKIVESCARQFILIGDVSKKVLWLGEKTAVPVEVVPFGWKSTRAKLESLGLDVILHLQGETPFVTDNGNYIFHARLTQKVDMAILAQHLSCTVGVVEHGLFLNMAHLAYLAAEDGIQTLTKAQA